MNERPQPFSTLVLGSHMQSLMPCRIHSYQLFIFLLISQIFPSQTPPTHSLTQAFFIRISNQSEKKSVKLDLWKGSGIPYPALVSHLGGTGSRPRAGLIKAEGTTAIHFCHSSCRIVLDPSSPKVGTGKVKRTTFRLRDGRVSCIWSGWEVLGGIRRMGEMGGNG